MNQMKFIPAHIHAVTDYLGGLLLLAAPNIFGFEDYGGAAVLIPRVLGVAILAMALLTDYRAGVIRLIPFPIHLIIDYGAGAFLAASPFLFGFSDADANVWLPHVVAGLGIFLISLFTETVPEREQNRTPA